MEHGIDIRDHPSMKIGQVEIRPVLFILEHGKAVYRYQWRYRDLNVFAESIESFRTEELAKLNYLETYQH